MTAVFLNGAFLDPGVAKVSAFDAGFQHGVGLFETMLGGVQAGVPEPDDVWVVDLHFHLERLAASASELGLMQSLRTTALADAVLETVRRSGLPRARIRLTLTGGDLNMLTAARSGGGEAGGQRGGPDPTVMIVAQPATEYPDAMFEHGVAVTIADGRANPLNPFEGHKTLNYWWRLRELQHAGAKGGAEAVVLSVTNHLVGGCVSNIFLVKDGELLTPIARGEELEVASPGSSSAAAEGVEPTAAARAGAGKRTPAVLPSPVLPGIVRSWVLSRAEIMDVPVRRRMLSITDLLAADEVFLTNSSWGVLPVVRVERETVAGGEVGPITRRLRRAWVDATVS
jgi:branched-chain amino acid aminotransferase